MRIVRADAMGMCVGVRNALQRVRCLPEPEHVTIYGDLVHNEVVLCELARRGFRQMPESDRERALPATRDVLVTAHGISDGERGRLVEAGKRIIDTTCPLVRRIHVAARALSDQGFRVLMIGRPGHVEVRGVTDDLDRFDVLPDPESVRSYGEARLGVVCQSTAQRSLARRVLARIRERNPQSTIRFIETICRPTRKRQEAIESLLGQVEVVVVVGGHHSNNTRQLVHRVLSRGLPAVHVASARELDPEWFSELTAVGLTAGTSTLARTVDEVERALGAMTGGRGGRMIG